MNDDALTNLLDLLGTDAVDEIVVVLCALAAEAAAPEARAALEQLANAIEVGGPDAITMIAGVIAGADAGEPAVATTTDPRVMSDAVAALQLAEAAQREGAQDFLARVGAVRAQILVVLVRRLNTR